MEITEPMTEELLTNLLKEEKYRKRISSANLNEETHITVDFNDIIESDQNLAIDLIKFPEKIFGELKKVATEQLHIECPESLLESIDIRINGLPSITLMRELGSSHIGTLIMIEGIITRATPAYPMVVKACYVCRRCGEKNFIPQIYSYLKSPLKCLNNGCRKKGPFDFVERESKWIDYQELMLQEKPEDLPAGQIPRTVEIRVIGDLVGFAKAGEYISIIGIYKAVKPSSSSKSKVFQAYLDANHIEILNKEIDRVELPQEEIDELKRLSETPLIHQRIINSIAPAIYGNKLIKEGISYLIFGGAKKEFHETTIRGEMNLLIIGDPSTAKSQILQWVASTVPRGIYSSGRGATAAGLTAAVIKSGDKFALEVGALVLADKGIACIDEMDKMRPEDRVAIHEAMEQHTISINKGGINTTLNARMALLGAANPTLGRYDQYRTVTENISLPVTILSRFDLIFVVRDTPDEHDEYMVDHILGLKRDIDENLPPLDREMFRKYITYARQINPKLSDECLEHLKEFYLSIRKSGVEDGTPIAITPRQLESLIRITTAHARIALRETTIIEDAKVAVKIMQSSLEQVGIDMETGEMDIDRVMTGVPTSKREKCGMILAIVMEAKDKGISRSDLYQILAEKGVSQNEVKSLILSMKDALYEPEVGIIRAIQY